MKERLYTIKNPVINPICKCCGSEILSDYDVMIFGLIKDSKCDTTKKLLKKMNLETDYHNFMEYMKHSKKILRSIKRLIRFNFIEKQKIINCDVCKKPSKFDKEASQYYCNKCGWWICV